MLPDSPILRLLRRLLPTLAAAFLTLPSFAAPRVAAILVYHRFGPAVADGMTTRTPVFEAQLAALQRAGYAIVPLDEVLAGLAGRGPLPAKAVAITVDDGHRTVYSDLLPIIRRQRLPVTLFIYPSAISNAAYAMTWGQLAELKATGLVAVHSHTWWHPDFRMVKRCMMPDEYAKFVRMQLEKPRRVLRTRLGAEADYLAWPYGIHDDELDEEARAAGYTAAFVLGERTATSNDPLMALPRYLIVDHTGVSGLLKLLDRGERQARERP